MPSDHRLRTTDNWQPDFDYHVHTIYSGHSGPDMFVPAVMARLAERGVRRAVLLEHVPPMMEETFRSFGDWLEGRGDRTAIDAIASEVLPRRKMFPDVEFLIGAEVDADPELMDGSLLLEDLSGIDVVLASTHVLPGGIGFWFNPPEIPAGERDSLLARWLAWIENVAGNPLVNVLSHPGAEIHNCGLSGDFGPGFREAFEPVLAAMAAGETAFDINETALRRFGEEALDGYVALVRLARERGVRFTAGSDAHHGVNLADYVLAPAVIREAGLEPGDFRHPPPVASRS